MDIHGCAVDAYKIIMNTNQYRDTIIKHIIPKNVSFLGSYMIFNPANEVILQEYYKNPNGEPTTEGRFCSEVVLELANKIRLTNGRFFCFSMGSILRTDYVCHHVSFLVEKRHDCLLVKMINSGLYYLCSSYGSILEYAVKNIGETLEKKVQFIHPYIDTAWVGFSFYQKCNPQDYCRGGLVGELRTFIDERMAVHRESYCQTWCILMLAWEINQMKKGYKIEENYFRTWTTNKKELEIMVRRFAVEIVSRFEDKIDFWSQFKHEIKNIGVKVRKEKFSIVLQRAFQTLHPEI
jgi:hypothetical protein